MNLNVGDYVRTDEGYIAKYIGKNKNRYCAGEHYSFNGTIRDIRWEECEEDDFLWKSQENQIVKSSPNIIDLIEVGDYVNSCPVDCINYDLDKEEDVVESITIIIPFQEVTDILYNEDIKSIVTKEQFEQMEYKI